jgi:FkbM family methyltransferase
VRSVIVKLLRVARLHPFARKINIARADSLRYIDALGLARGASAFFRFRRAKPGSLVSVRIPGSKTPLQIRAGTEDAIVFQQVFFERQYDLDLSSHPKLIIDGGAHVGCATRFFASKYPDAIIVAIEPESTNFTLLKANVGGCRNVLPIRAALWGTPAVLNIVDPHSASWAFQVEEGNSEGIATTLGLTVDELLAWSASSSIDILKLDVEGAEREIFSSDCTHWMGAVSAMIIELHDRFVAGCREALERATAGFEFTESVSGECVVLQRKQ